MSTRSKSFYQFALLLLQLQKLPTQLLATSFIQIPKLNIALTKIVQQLEVSLSCCGNTVDASCHNNSDIQPRRQKMENTFDSTYIINKAKYDEFLAEANKLAIAVYTIPAFVKQIKELDKVWFLQKYA